MLDVITVKQVDGDMLRCMKGQLDESKAKSRNSGNGEEDSGDMDSILNTFPWL